ncbi:MAG: hypothetical protein ACQER4_03550 [Bacteroidota bacterium]
MIDYIAILDYDHLDNGLFLASLANALASRGEERGLLIHGDSAYTERLLQTGVMREEARVRAMRDLNHRLIALLADHGVSAIGLNGHQRGLIKQSVESGKIQLDVSQLQNLPGTPQLVLSALGMTDDGERTSIPLPELAAAASRQLSVHRVYLFHASDEREILTDMEEKEIDQDQIGVLLQPNEIPVGFHTMPVAVQLTTARQFSSSRPTSVLIRPSSSAAT